ncbi:4-hydroxy-3-methylbut-2-enyl diphosphate reductase [Terrisporobacter mayombei]|uniref:4-hydroxy-3-methylbut-2-enyl diphosphate reductase n=1 Tax=Terrisporobacter mayombei TaxID=1541 RepID=A0ABY9PZP4_9FIRM|nr:4-hydroxy-3-methylbut-2-enyl diphosphate reductase [Terrisporobacter mayombei]MCC3868571.1 4-hydroxy-3-methylbut-2-enyl diphosphate reductase [Terrisporobacter mayombei]WMT80728.1 4-hydroxy-3-methylbut-2-enyl diphosphate reductase [Terrisporobacter mayombei]
MKVRIAENAGFCFGVKRAMNMAWDELENKTSDSVYSLGPLIHNKQAVDRYKEKGLMEMDSLDKIPNDSKLIIRSHGISKKIYTESKSKNMDIVDTTCPFVKKIHDIVREFSNKGCKIIIVGNATHPEIVGINGWCDNDAIIINSEEEVDNITFNSNDKYCVVSQTTANLESFDKIVSKLKSKIQDLTVNNTICSATKERQLSATELAKEVDCMVVIGGKHSSNTQKLVNICKNIVPTFSIETKEELEKSKLEKFKVAGVTAGASTPDWIIDEVIEYLKEI